MDVNERDTRISDTKPRRHFARAVIIAAVAVLSMNLGASAQDDERQSLLAQIKDLVKQGKYSEAVPIAEKLLAAAEQALDPEHPEVAVACNALAETLRLSGRFADARPYYERNLAIRKKVSGPESEETASAINNLGALHYDEGDYVGAESLYRGALAIREAMFGPVHIKVAGSLNNIGNALSDQGRLKDAEPFYRRSLAIREKALGPNDPDIAASIGNLAVLLTELGRYDEAEQCFTRVIAIVERAFGPAHPDLASASNNLANLYFRQERLTEAEPLYLRALAIREKALGTDHAQTGMCLNNLGLLYYVMGRFAEAETFLRKSLAVHERALGPEHPGVAEALNSLAVLRYDQGRYDEVARLYERSLAIREKILGPDHHNVAMSLSNIANLEKLFGRLNRAERLHRRSLAIDKKAFGEEHQIVGKSLMDLGAVLVDAGRLEEAEILYKRAASIAKKAFGPDSSMEAMILMNHGELELRRFRFDKAEKNLTRSLALFERVLGGSHRFVGECLRHLAVSYHEMGRHDRAANVLDRALENFRYRLARQFTYMSETDRLAYLDAAEDLFAVYFTHYLSARTMDPEAAEKLYDLVLWRKGLVAQSVAALRRRVVRSADPEALSLFNSLVVRRSRLARLATVTDEVEESPSERIQDLTREANELEQRLVRLVPSINVGMQTSAWRDVARTLRPDEAAVEIARYKVHDVRDRPDETRYVALVLSPGVRSAPMLVELGDAESIDRAVLEEHAAVLQAGQARRLDHDEPAHDVPEDTAQRIADTVWQPIAKALGAARYVYLSPDGLLSRVSWAALPAGQERRIIDGRDVRVISSTRDLTRSPRSFTSRSAILVGDPRFDLTADAQRIAMRNAADASAAEPRTRSHWRSADLRGTAVKALPHAGVEIGAIRERLEGGGWRVDALTGAAATEEAVKRVQGPRVLHVATHGFFLEDRSDNPESRDAEPWSARENPMLRAGLLFTGAERTLTQHAAPEDLEDGVLTAYEAASLDLDGTELVVLSACDTGLGDVKNGEGVLGLRRALHVAGADAVLMSLWAVPDRETQELMALFYDNWLAGKGKQEALREAQLAMRETVKRRYGSDLPFYWAAFIVEGR